MNTHLFKAISILLFSLSCATPNAWAGPVLDRIKETGRINIGSRETSMPFSYVAQAGQKPTGYSVDLCQKIIESVRKRVGLKQLEVNHVMVTAATRIETVLQDKVDLNCESTTNSAERREKVAFSVPHYITGSRYLVRAGTTLKDLRDFEGKKLVSTAGSSPLKAAAQAIKDRSLKITLLEAPDHPKAVDMVAKGEADGFVMDEVLLVAQVAGRPDPEKFAITGKYLTTDALGLMMSKSDLELKLLVDTELRRLIQAREAHAIHDRWFLQPIAPKGTALNIRMPHMLRDFWKYPNDWVPN
jgi:ABC-type amino acid transport substrate-binding protein